MSAKKRTASSRERAIPLLFDPADGPLLHPSAVIQEVESGSESESDESHYSGLESERDTDIEDLEALGSGLEEESGDKKDQEEEGEGEEDDGSLRNGGDETLFSEPAGKGEEEEEEEGWRSSKEEWLKSWREAEDTDTSDEEEVRNTVGNIPLEWYDDYPHIGYDLDGKKILKPAKGDELDEFLSKMEDPNYWRKVHDKVTRKDIVLTDEQLAMVQRIQKSEFPETGYDPYEPYIDFFTHEKMIHPLSSAPEPKSRFIPSRWEHKKVVKLVHAIKMGWIKPKKRPEGPKFYMLWSDADQAGKLRHKMHIPAPKVKLPGHSESYNPPPEYLPTEEEVKEWEEMDPVDRPNNFLTHKFNSLREVPAYPNFIQERFERCLDLYLCPRQRRMRVQVDPEDLIPTLPKPKDLQPFPTTEAIVYEGHTSLVRCLSVEPQGQWLASGSDDESLRLWEVETGRCMSCLRLPGRPHSLAFCPNTNLTVLIVAVDNSVYLINHSLGDKLLVTATDTALSSLETPASGEAPGTTTPSPVSWQLSSEDEQRLGYRVCLRHSKPVKQVVWHSKGDYFAAVLSDAAGSAVVIHQLSKRRSQNPFKKLKGLVQSVMFHPTRPFFLVATQTYVKVYNLVKQELTKKLLSGVKWISSLDIHPQGDNLIIGSYDKRLCWFDMDLSTKPYRVIRHHKQAIRQVCYHPRYPLFASCGDDGAVIICHGMVYNDLMQNPLIVPVKVLKGHRVTDSLGVLDCQFHPTQPWIFTAGADSTLRLYT